MRKTLSVSIAVCLVLSLFTGVFAPVPEARAETEGVWGYSVGGGNATITGYAGTGGTVVIPDTLGGYSVTSIGASAFASKTILTGVTIPNSVTSIGNYAFYMCTGLTAVYFLGNAPSGTDTMFTSCGSGFTVYYVSDKTGWTNPWYGYSTATFTALSLTPAAGPVKRVNDMVTLTLHFDVTSGAKANAFVATINYDMTYLTYSGCTYNTTGYPFPTKVEVTATSGTVRIAGGRGNSLGFAPAGDIATITFTAAAETPAYTTISFNTAADTYSGRAASGVWEQRLTFVQGVAVPTFTTDANITVKNERTITASAGTNGSISPSGDVPVPYGTNKTFTITPVADYHVLDVLVDGVSVGAVASYTFTNVTANHTISASFDANFWVVTVEQPNARISGVTPDWIQYVTKGADATFHVTPTTTDYSYIYSTSRNGVDPVPLAQGGASFFTTHNVGQAQELVFTNITEPTAIVVNLFRRGNINGGSGTLVPDSADAVNGSDASVLIDQWRKTQGTGTGQIPLLVADLDNNQKVDIVDLSMMMSLWTGDIS
jgi:hypothetical protein